MCVLHDLGKGFMSLLGKLPAIRPWNKRSHHGKEKIMTMDEPKNEGKMEFHSDALWISILVYGIHGATFEELRLFSIYVPHFSDKQRGCLWSNKGYRACSAENHSGYHREPLSFLLSYGSCLVGEKLLDQRPHWAKNINILWFKSSPLPVSYLDSTLSGL